MAKKADENLNDELLVSLLLMDDVGESSDISVFGANVSITFGPE